MLVEEEAEATSCLLAPPPGLPACADSPLFTWIGREL